jgi:GNAT superfamily N-acetyltransferase
MYDAVELSLRQFTQAWQLMAAGSPGYTRKVEAGIDYIFSGLPIGFFNVALLDGRRISGDALTSQGQAACAWASAWNVPWLLVVTHEALQPGVDATASLDSCGLAPMMALTGMIAKRIAPPSRVPEGLDLTVPHENERCAALIDLNSLAYGMSLDACKPVIGTRSFWKDHVPVVGWSGGMPASGAAVMMVDGYRYVALVATDPAHQRRGYAEAAMRRALDVAADQHGAVPSFLHATDAGRPIYARMGYSPVSTHTIFMENRFLEGH